MKTRVLNADGTFSAYTGPAPVIAPKSATIEAKIADRKHLDEVAKESGFVAENPASGGLTKEDKIALEDMGLVDMMQLASTRKVKVPKLLQSYEDIKGFLLGEEKALVESVPTPVSNWKDDIQSGMSIPEMRKVAKAQKIKIPGSVKKAADMKMFLLGFGEETEL